MHAKPNEKKEPKPRTATASEEAISEEERVGLDPDVTDNTDSRKRKYLRIQDDIPRGREHGREGDASEVERGACDVETTTQTSGR